MSRALALALVALTVACDGPDGGSGPSDAGGSGLAPVVLRAGEVPEGLEPDQAGPIASIRDVLPLRRRFPNLPPLADGLAEGFVEGYRRSFAGPDGAASSTVVRMADPTVASALVAYLRLLPVGGHAGTPEEVPATGLGEKGYGWRLLVPRRESSGYVWRSGDLVAAVTLSGPVGRANPEASLPLAERVDERLA
ncbi:MAG: hypothetical protein ACRDIZ_01400 [Actinomycetota bacterium]